MICLDLFRKNRPRNQPSSSSADDLVPSPLSSLSHFPLFPSQFSYLKCYLPLSSFNTSLLHINPTDPLSSPLSSDFKWSPFSPDSSLLFLPPFLAIALTLSLRLLCTLLLLNTFFTCTF
eukprot:GILI01026622.1.p1 GENE.GILI01026622.1~~GILI01026622.1.p1  ORF type:complete len:119 (+),score=15.39 GILI01026622.1:74-430(+)